MSSKSRVLRSAFTLIEMLVVFAIVAILLAILLAAIQKARESANCKKCASNLRQLAIAASNYEGNNGSLPSGGFGWTWFGDPSQKGIKQPGAWTFTLLPYLEQEETFSAAGSPAGARDAMVTPVSIFSCP